MKFLNPVCVALAVLVVRMFRKRRRPASGAKAPA